MANLPHYTAAVVCMILRISVDIVSCAGMNATFGEKGHEVNVSTYQMVILLLSNEAD